MIFPPLKRNLEENGQFVNHPDCQESLPMMIAFFQKVGYEPPWIGYYAIVNEELVGMGAFKGPPKNGKVEIAYVTVERFRGKGNGGIICKKLVEIALENDADIDVRARTLPEVNHSTRILEKNHFVLVGTVDDPEDGEVWEWRYEKNP